MNALLANGQINTRLRINLAGVQPNTVPIQGVPSQIFGGAVQSQVPQHATIGTQFVSGQFSPHARYLSQQLVGSQLQAAPSNVVFPSSSISAPTSYAQIGDPSNVQYLENDDSSHLLYKRNGESEKVVKKREAANNKKLDKRALVTLTDGSVIDDRVIASNPFDFDGLAQFGAPAFQEHLSKMMDIEDEIREHDREPAEGEVQAVYGLCSTCEVEPFEGAIVLGWKDVKVVTEHALRAKSLGGCGQF